MRKLSVDQGKTCETATSGQCSCRCGGRAHGRSNTVPSNDYFSKLPRNDPHYIKPKITSDMDKTTRDRLMRGERVMNDLKRLHKRGTRYEFRQHLDQEGLCVNCDTPTVLYVRFGFEYPVCRECLVKAYGTAELNIVDIPAELGMARAC